MRDFTRALCRLDRSEIVNTNSLKSWVDVDREPAMASPQYHQLVPSPHAHGHASAAAAAGGGGLLEPRREQEELSPTGLVGETDSSRFEK